MNRLYEIISGLRETQGISDAELARRVGIRQGLLSDLKKNDNQELKFDNLKKSAEYFRVPLDFFSETGDPNPRDIPPLQPASRDQVLFALYKEVPEEITDAEMEEIQQYAEMVLLRKRAKKDVKGE